MEDKKLLEVGDMIYFSQYGKLTSRRKITRVTKTQAFYRVNENYEGKVKRSVDGGYVRSIPVERFSSTYIRKETPELKSEFNRKLLENKFSKIDVTKLSDEVLEKILILTHIES